MANFPSRLRKLRAENGLTQTDLAEELHKTKATISNYESGRYEPSIDVIEDLANFFNVTADYLLGMTEHKYRIAKEDLPEEIRKLIISGDIKYIEAIKDAKQKGLSPQAIKAIIETIGSLDIKKD